MKIEKSPLQKAAEKAAIQRAERRELQISSWIGSHWHIKKLFFNRWLFVFANMEGFKFKD